MAKPSFNLLQGFRCEASAIVLYAFDLLMLRGKDVLLWPLEDRREQLRDVVQPLPDTIRFSETFKRAAARFGAGGAKTDEMSGSTSINMPWTDSSKRLSARGSSNPAHRDKSRAKRDL